MKHLNLLFTGLLSLGLMVLLSSCLSDKDKSAEVEKTTADLIAQEIEHKTVIEPGLLPRRFQETGYLIDDDLGETEEEDEEEYKIKVGSNISSSKGPLPLRDIMKGLAKIKNMNISWASDVQQNVLVDVDIRANDDFYEAIDNILRQVDYFHEVMGTTIVIKYKETKRYHVAMPFIKQEYTTNIGGNILGSGGSSTVGNILLNSNGNTFDVWENIQKNIDILIATWSTTLTAATTAAPAGDGEAADAPVQTAAQQVSAGGTSYTIDKPVGLITVHAPRSLQKRIEEYLDSLDRELYKQIMIEAKIIEVQLTDNMSLGINWNTLLQNLKFAGGSFGAITDYGKTNTENNSNANSLTYTNSDGSTRTISSGKSSDTTSGGTNGTTSDTADGTTSGGDDGDTSTGSTDYGTSDTTSGTSNRTSSSSDSLVRTLADSTSLTSAVTSTVATLITGGASNAAGAAISMAAFSFDNFINALSEQGQTTILSNPKLSVMNGQPALISVGRNVTYIDSIESSTDGTGANARVTYTVNTERILSGVGLALTAVVNRQNEIIMNIIPITSELMEPIEYELIGEGKIGLPIVNIREMSTTVKIKDGAMLVIGGLISKTESQVGDFIPGTSNIPYFKYLFGYEETKKLQRELIILLRPTIL